MSNHPLTIIDSSWFDKTQFIKNIPQPAYVIVDNPNILSDNLPNIFIQVEPTIICNNDDYLNNSWEKYHTIITFNSNILKSCPNAKMYVYGTTWIPKEYYDNINITKKKYSISTLAGSKLINNALGHKFRQEIHHNQPLFRDYPITFFRSFHQLPHINDYGNNPFLQIGDDTSHKCKIRLFEEFQFSIIIENSKQENYFTEKIMDCILTKTIPIYWGCPNISDYFDTTGWIILENASIEELCSKLSQLDSNYYSKYFDIIEKNYFKSFNYINIYENINNAK
jgi:hypothetical protein